MVSYNRMENYSGTISKLDLKNALSDVVNKYLFQKNVYYIMQVVNWKSSKVDALIYYLYLFVYF